MLARSKSVFGIFKLKPKVRPYEIDEAFETFTDLQDGYARLESFRSSAQSKGEDPFDYVILPIDSKKQGMLPPGV